MNKIKIIADSTVDLSKDLIDLYDIKIVPLHVTFKGDEKDYLDGETITSEEVYKKAEELKVTPVTGARNTEELIGDFAPFIEEGYDILFTGIGSGLSSTYNNALLAANEFPKGRIEIIDSQNLSTGTGLLVVKMGKLVKEGKDIHEIATIIRGLVPKVSAKFCIDRLDYLYKGGRCSGMTKMLATLFQIHPVAKVIDNKLTVYRKPRGKYEKAVNEQIQEFYDDLSKDNIDTDCLFITHSGRIEGFDQYIYSKISNDFPKENIYITQAGCVVSSHCGPKTIGILYILKEKL